jgi:hypothetical protein
VASLLHDTLLVEARLRPGSFEAYSRLNETLMELRGPGLADAPADVPEVGRCLLLKPRASTACRHLPHHVHVQEPQVVQSSVEDAIPVEEFPSYEDDFGLVEEETNRTPHASTPVRKRFLRDSKSSQWSLEDVLYQPQHPPPYREHGPLQSTPAATNSPGSTEEKRPHSALDRAGSPTPEPPVPVRGSTS